MVKHFRNGRLGDFMKKIILLCSLLSGCAVYNPHPYIGGGYEPHYHSYYIPTPIRHEHHYQYYGNHWR